MKSNGAFLVILFLTFGMLITSITQFVYSQTVENEIIENTLETVEKATTEGLSEITESVSNATESAIAGAREQIEESVSGAKSAVANATEGTQTAATNATEGTQTAATNATEGTQTA